MKIQIIKKDWWRKHWWHLVLAAVAVLLALFFYQNRNPASKKQISAKERAAADSTVRTENRANFIRDSVKREKEKEKLVAKKQEEQNNLSVSNAKKEAKAKTVSGNINPDHLFWAASALFLFGFCIRLRNSGNGGLSEPISRAAKANKKWGYLLILLSIPMFVVDYIVLKDENEQWKKAKVIIQKVAIPEDPALTKWRIDSAALANPGRLVPVPDLATQRRNDSLTDVIKALSGLMSTNSGKYVAVVDSLSSIITKLSKQQPVHQDTAKPPKIGKPKPKKTLTWPKGFQ